MFRNEQILKDGLLSFIEFINRTWHCRIIWKCRLGDLISDLQNMSYGKKTERIVFNITRK